MDRWYRDWGLGVVKAVLKTRVRVRFQNVPWRWADANGLVTYDRAHQRYLEVQ